MAQLDDDETEPRIVESEQPTLVVWSSIWPDRPNDQIRFEISSDDAGGSQLRWILESPDPFPSDAVLGHMRYRINYLINGQMRQSLG